MYKLCENINGIWNAAVAKVKAEVKAKQSLSSAGLIGDWKIQLKINIESTFCYAVWPLNCSVVLGGVECEECDEIIIWF